MENITDDITFFETKNDDFLESDIDIELGSWAEADLTTGSETDDD